MKMISFSRLVLFGAIITGALIGGCKKDEKTLAECMYGDWDVRIIDINNMATPPSDMTFEFNDDGTFTLRFLWQGSTNYRMDGEWEVDEKKAEATLTYEIQSTVYVGLVGFLLAKDITNEEYDISFSDDKDDLTIDGNISGLRVILEMKRD